MAERRVPVAVRKVLGWLAENAGPLHPLTSALRWAFVFHRQLERDMAFIRAAGMAYASMVALVPGLAVAWFVMAAVGAGDPESSLGVLFDQAFGAVPGLKETLLPLLAQVDLQAAGVVAVAGLLVVASRLYLMVEKAYCDVFSVSVTRRSMTTRLLSFYFCMTAGPLAAAMLMRGGFRLASGFGMHGGTEVAALALQFLALVLALKLLPATHVRWKPALVGAGVSFVLLEAGRRGVELYVIWVAGADPLGAVYGSLGFIPIFLMWIYLIWLFVLLGVEVAQVMQNYAQLYEHEMHLADEGPDWPTLETAVRVAAWVGWNFANGHGPITAEGLHDRTHLELRVLQPVLDALADLDVVVRAGTGWILARPADAISLSDLAVHWRRSTGVGEPDDLLSSSLQSVLEKQGSLADGIDSWLPTAAPAVPREVTTS